MPQAVVMINWAIFLLTKVQLSTTLILNKYKYIYISYLSKAVSWPIRCMSHTVNCFDPVGSYIRRNRKNYSIVLCALEERMNHLLVCMTRKVFTFFQPLKISIFSLSIERNFRNIKYKSDFKNIHIEISNLSKAASWLIRCMSYTVKCFDLSQ